MIQVTSIISLVALCRDEASSFTLISLTHFSKQSEVINHTHRTDFFFSFRTLFIHFLSLTSNHHQYMHPYISSLQDPNLSSSFSYFSEILQGLTNYSFNAPVLNTSVLQVPLTFKNSTRRNSRFHIFDMVYDIVKQLIAFVSHMSLLAYLFAASILCYLDCQKQIPVQVFCLFALFFDSFLFFCCCCFFLIYGLILHFLKKISSHNTTMAFHDTDGLS